MENKFRFNLFDKAIKTVGSQKKLIDFINKKSKKYNIRRNHSRLNLYSWIKGKKINRGKIKKINVPLWILIECSKLISKSEKVNNKIMKSIEKNIDYYTVWGNANPITRPKLPIYLTPELISIIFNFLGDGHIGRKQVCSSYRQMNKEGLNNFLSRLKNIFGEFDYSKGEFKHGKLNVPKVITEFYKYYFNLPDTSTFKAYIPSNIKKLDKKNLTAGLISFIVDEGHIGEVITIYSKNERLLKDIREIAIKCDYECNIIREKYRYGVFDSYRFHISTKSYLKMHNDISKLEKEFPLCNLAQKRKKFNILIKRKQRKNRQDKEGVTKKKILALLKKRPRIIDELVKILNIGNSGIREHLGDLEDKKKVRKLRRDKRKIVWSIK